MEKPLETSMEQLHASRKPSMNLDPVLLLIPDNPAILALYVLGSAATGSMRPDSDIDLAILCEPGQEFTSLQRAELAADATCCLGRDVDCGELSSRNLVYAREAILKGRRLFARDPSRVDAMETNLLSMYIRFNEDRREVLDAYRAR